MSVFELYLIFTVLPSLKAGITIVLVLWGTFGGIVVAISLMEGAEKIYNPIISASKIVLPMLFLIVVLVPSESQLKYIIGGAYVTNIENIEKLPPNLVDAANTFLEKMNESE